MDNNLINGFKAENDDSDNEAELNLSRYTSVPETLAALETSGSFETLETSDKPAQKSIAEQLKADTSTNVKQKKILIVPNKQQQTKVTSSKVNSHLEMQKYIAKIEAEKTKQAKLRITNNHENIQDWHNQQNESIKQLQGMHSAVQDLLDKFENFSINSYNNYIQQFASGQIELFNLIHTHYNTYKELAAKSKDKEYYDAIDNYSLYLDKIIYTLSSFGIEEIISERGTRFNESIHEAINSTKNYFATIIIVRKSLRSGFMYKDIVLQKELVEIA